MKAAVCYNFAEPLVVEEVEIDDPKAGEVKVKLAATAICHSDIHLMDGDWGGRLPVVAGHEGSGTVVAIGEGVNRVKRGDRVVVSLLRSCDECFYCSSGLPHLCEGNFALARESRLRNQKGEKIYHGIRTAAFAEQCVVDQSQLAVIPAEIRPEQAALLGCGVITGTGAVLNTAKVKSGESVVVIGAGGVGLNAIQGAALAGAEPIIAMDLLDSKLEAARLFGATHTINAAENESPIEAVRELTAGRGADYVFVTVGSEAAMKQSLQLTRGRGTVVFVGIPQLRAKVPLAAYFHVLGEQRVIGSFMGSTQLQTDVPKLVEFYREGRLKLAELISGHYSLEQINEAIDSTRRGEALRNVIVY